MQDNIGTYDTENAKQISLEFLLKIMGDKGARKIYIKKLASNDNSKNQPYFGHHLTDLPFIPTGPMVASQSTSQKSNNKKRTIKYQTSINLKWIDAEASTYPAPHAKLIYYPQYPEVRFSGFLLGSKADISQWMSPEKQGRAEGRWLLLGIADNKAVYAYLATPEAALSQELEKTEFTRTTNIFGEINIKDRTSITDTKSVLLQKLLDIHQMGWVAGQKLDKNMMPKPYRAQNGGGYTLEALLGIYPNGIAEPDYLGWEVKQFGVKEFPLKSARPTTLMTPEPNGGVYTTDSAANFVRRFGYPDKSGKPDRINFGGRHIVGKECAATQLTLRLDGFDSEAKKITKAAGAIILIDNSETVAASWSFEKIMDHWKRKHSQCVYVPCVMRQAQTGGREYYYGNNIELGRGTDFEMFLSAMLAGHVYYDPGIKLEKASDPNSSPKRRSQFRVNHKHIKQLYKNLDFIDVTDPFA